MKDKLLIGFAAVVAAQVLLLLGMIGFNENTLRTGVKVVLQTAPVDPRSLFQGDYVVLGYQAGILPDYWPEQPKQGDTVYVTLRPGQEVWEAREYLLAPPPEGQVFLKGAVGANCRLDFGIGTYFVPEGSGHVIEQAMFSGDPLAVKVRAAVDPNGNAVIDQLLVYGKPFDSKMAPRPTPALPREPPAAGSPVPPEDPRAPRPVPNFRTC